MSSSATTAPVRPIEYGTTRNKVYDVANPAFDEDVGLGWWRSQAATASDEDEHFLFPAIPPPLARSSALVSEVIDSTPKKDIRADADSMLQLDNAAGPSPAPAPLSTPPLATVPSDLPFATGPRRSMLEPLVSVPITVPIACPVGPVFSFISLFRRQSVFYLRFARSAGCQSVFYLRFARSAGIRMFVIKTFACSLLVQSTGLSLAVCLSRPFD